MQGVLQMGIKTPSSELEERESWIYSLKNKSVWVSQHRNKKNKLNIRAVIAKEETTPGSGSQLQLI